MHWRKPGQAKWVPLLDTTTIKETQQTYWPISISEDKFHCIILKVLPPPLSILQDANCRGKKKTLTSQDPYSVNLNSLSPVTRNKSLPQTALRPPRSKNVTCVFPFYIHFLKTLSRHARQLRVAHNYLVKKR